VTAARAALALLVAFGAGCSGEDAARPAPEPTLAADPQPDPEPEPLAPAPLPAGPYFIRVTGDDYRWRLRYPGGDGLLDTEDDVVTWRHLHLPAEREVVLDLASVDYVYTFYVPQLDILEVALPDVPFEYDLETGRAARHDLLGSQMCGYTHPELLGDVIVEDEPDFTAWLREQGG
jgi:cytochrome c oxidase subunit 2